MLKKLSYYRSVPCLPAALSVDSDCKASSFGCLHWPVHPLGHYTMSTPNVKDVVREKYGQAALCVTSGAGNPCCGDAPSVPEGPVIQ